MRRKEAVELARTTYFLPEEAIVVEIGSFLGCSTVLLGGARKLRQSGKVHCIDPFDASGDSYSVPVYRDIAGSLPISLRARFEENIRLAGLTDWVEVHQGKASEIARQWKAPIDLLFMDGDQSDRGAREDYEHWSGFLKAGGILAIHHSAPGFYAPDHGGSRLLVENVVHPPLYAEIRCIGTTTFARRMQA
ncbi:MAG: class I SAM-dependent methyltransferase [Terriglobia bacterium]